MKFQITMNMPSFTAGNLVHQIIADYPCKSLTEFIKVLSANDFVVVDEWYRNAETKEYYIAGEVALNPLIVGKIKVFKNSGGF
ncbi:MAG: hypothetical protein WCG06_01895 [Candidatus Omnitrophota bacterium]